MSTPDQTAAARYVLACNRDYTLELEEALAALDALRKEKSC